MTESITARRTMLERDGLHVGVITYRELHSGAWRTVLAAFAEDNPGISCPAHTKEDANERHDDAVRMVKLMGFAEVVV